MSISISALDELANDMLELYEESEIELMHIIAIYLAVNNSTNAWIERRYSEIAGIRNALKGILDDTRKKRLALSKNCIETAYKYGTQGFMEEANAFTQMLSVYKLPNAAKNTARILIELNDMLDSADRIILRKANDEYTNIIGRTAALVSNKTISLREAVRRELEQFADRGITSFVDKSGRSWDMATYAEMATITAVERSVLDGFVHSMIENDEDLAIVSSHIGACPLCVAWENVVISITGSSTYYPSLKEAQDAGLFHPRCLHRLHVYHEGSDYMARDAPREVLPATNEYSVRQKQRAYERKIRQWKRRMAVATEPIEERIAYARVRTYQQRIRDLIRDNRGAKLTRKYWREGGVIKLSPEAKRMKPVRIAK